MLKDIQKLRSPDPYFSGEAGSIGSALEQLHEDMQKLELPECVPESVRRWAQAVAEPGAIVITARLQRQKKHVHRCNGSLAA